MFHVQLVRSTSRSLASCFRPHTMRRLTPTQATIILRRHMATATPTPPTLKSASASAGTGTGAKPEEKEKQNPRHKNRHMNIFMKKVTSAALVLIPGCLISAAFLVLFADRSHQHPAVLRAYEIMQASPTIRSTLLSTDHITWSIGRWFSRFFSDSPFHPGTLFQGSLTNNTADLYFSIYPDGTGPCYVRVRAHTRAGVDTDTPTQDVASIMNSKLSEKPTPNAQPFSPPPLSIRERVLPWILDIKSAPSTPVPTDWIIDELTIWDTTISDIHPHPLVYTYDPITQHFEERRLNSDRATSQWFIKRHQNQFLLAALPTFVILRTLTKRIRTHNVRSYETWLQNQITLHRTVNRALGAPVHTAGDEQNTGVVSRSLVNITVPLLGRLQTGRVHVSAVYDADAAARSGLLSQYHFRKHWRVISATMHVDGGAQNVPLKWEDRAKSMRELRLL